MNDSSNGRVSTSSGEGSIEAYWNAPDTLFVRVVWDCPTDGPRVAKGTYSPPPSVESGGTLTYGQAAELAGHFMKECPCRAGDALKQHTMVAQARILMVAEAA